MSAFRVIVLGCTGGPRENNLSSYLLAPANSSNFIALDAGTLLSGIDVALQRGAFEDLDLKHATLAPAGVVLHRHIKAYLLSHVHLDHVAGLVHASQVEEKKPLYGIDPTIDHLRDHLFNNIIWPNCGSEGNNASHQFTYHRLAPEKEVPIAHTEFSVTPFRLCHPHDYPSTAFLVRHKEDYFLYCGDTSADSNEQEKRLSHVWEHVAPLVDANTLKGIMLECSYPTEEAMNSMYGHLAPSLMMEELSHLATLTKNPLTKLKVLVTHRKESLSKQTKELISQQLTQSNTLGLHLLFPTQGDVIYF